MFKKTCRHDDHSQILNQWLCLSSSLEKIIQWKEDNWTLMCFGDGIDG